MGLKFYRLPAILALVLLVLAGCPSVFVTPPPLDRASQAGAMEVALANPAATFCLDMGYMYQVRAAPDGGQYGICIFPEGGECDGWDYFRGECGPASQEFDLLGHQALYCINQGYLLEVHQNAFGKFGVCKFPDGSQCTTDTFLAGLCGPQPEATVAEILGIAEEAVAVAEEAAVEAVAEEAPAEAVAEEAPAEAVAEEAPAEAVAEEAPAEAVAEEAAAEAVAEEAAAEAVAEEAAAEAVAEEAPAEAVAEEAAAEAVAEEASAEAVAEEAPAEAVAGEDEVVGSLVNVVAAAGLLGATQVDVLVEGNEIASIDDQAAVYALVKALNANLALIPRNRCLSTYTLRFHLTGGAVQTFGYACGGNLAGAILRGDQAFWAGQDVVAPEAFNALMAAHLEGLDP